MRITRFIVLGAVLAALFGVFAPPAAAFRWTDGTRIHPEGVVGKSYSHTYEMVGGTPPASFAVVSGSLPPGLSLSSDGKITGTPTTAGSYSFWVEATDAWENPMKTQELFTINVASGVKLTTQSLSPTRAIAGDPYSVTLTATGGGTKTWSVTAGALPQGLTLSSTGTISGTPTTAGSYKFTVKVSEEGGNYFDQREFSLEVVAKLAATPPTTVPTAEVGRPFPKMTPPTATGGLAPYTWSLAPGTTLPKGLSLDPATGTITGTPLVAGTSTLKLALADGSGQTGTVDIALTVAARLKIATKKLLVAKVGVAYEAEIETAGGVEPFKWRISSGRLPVGLPFVKSSGAFVGTARQAGVFEVTVEVKDALGAVSTQTLELTVVAKLLIKTQKLLAAKQGQAYSAQIVTAGGLGPLKWKVVGGKFPVGIRLNKATGTLIGTPRQAGVFEVTIQVTDRLGTVTTKTLVLKVLPPSK